MSLDFPATGQALWAMADASGIRPEWVLPVLYSESSFNPAVVNSIGCTGVNQLCQNIPSGYASWTASQQIAGSVSPMMQSIEKQYGPLRSGARVYQANFLPGTLPYAKALSSVIAVRGSSAVIRGGGGLTNAAVYSANPGLDVNGDGQITLQDLATQVQRMASRSAVQQAIAQTYALRPGESSTNPAYGTDFPIGAGLSVGVAFAIGSTVLAAGAAAAYYVTYGRLPIGRFG